VITEPMWEVAPEAKGLGDVFGREMVAAPGYVDPLARIFDPAFPADGAPSWEYEHSRVEPFIPSRLHPKQLDALHAGGTHRHLWLFWGNQVGKTTLGAILTVLVALGRSVTLADGTTWTPRWAPPIEAWASALTWELWENVLLPELLTWIPVDRLVDAPEPFKHSTKRTILVRADNGRLSRITGKAAEQGRAKYQARRLHWVWLDEEHPEDVWDELLPRLLRHGGVTFASMTPLKGLTWVFDRYYEPWQRGEHPPGSHYVSHAGIGDNPSIAKEAIDALKQELRHNPAQLAARLGGQFVRPSGVVLPFDRAKHLTDPADPQWTPEAVRAAFADGRLAPFVGIDYGLWRWSMVLAAVDRVGALVVLDEVFSQRQSTDARAALLNDTLRFWGVPDSVTIVGDSANPQDQLELNLALDRRKSRYVVGAVTKEPGSRSNAVQRIENLLNRGAFHVRAGIVRIAAKGDGLRVWRLGWNASAEGKPVEGSRLLWEFNNWRYPKVREGTGGERRAQDDDPDDDSADGADAIAALRYLVLTWWAAATPQAPKRHPTKEEEIWADALRDPRAPEPESFEESDESHQYGGSAVREG
jgi:phage terminase large subunit-like protein